MKKITFDYKSLYTCSMWGQILWINIHFSEPLHFTGPEYLKKRALLEIVDGSENPDTTLHEPLLAEEEPLPTPPESPLMNELDSLMPGSSPGRTPSPSPGIICKEDPKLLSPGSCNEDKPIKGVSKANSKPNSRPTTPSASATAPTLAVPEGGGAPSSRGPTRTPSRHSNKNEQGSDLEIKPLQKFESQSKAPDVSSAPTASVRNSLISTDEEEASLPSFKSPKAATVEPKSTELKTERASSLQERVPLENKVTRDVSRSSSKAEAKPLPKRQPSPAPSPKPTPVIEPKTVPKQVEAKPIVAKPALKLEPKPEARLKALVSTQGHEMTSDSLDQEVKKTSFLKYLNSFMTKST